MEIYRLNRILVHLAGYKINIHNIYLYIIFIIMYKNQNKLLIYFIFYKL